MDAQVAYGFHHLRDEKPYLAQGAVANKVPIKPSNGAMFGIIMMRELWLFVSSFLWNHIVSIFFSISERYIPFHSDYWLEILYQLPVLSSGHNCHGYIM